MKGCWVLGVAARMRTRRFRDSNDVPSRGGSADGDNVKMMMDLHGYLELGCLES